MSNSQLEQEEKVRVSWEILAILLLRIEILKKDGIDKNNNKKRYDIEFTGKKKFRRVVTEKYHLLYYWC